MSLYLSLSFSLSLSGSLWLSLSFSSLSPPSPYLFLRRLLRLEVPQAPAPFAVQHKVPPLVAPAADALADPQPRLRQHGPHAVPLPGRVELRAALEVRLVHPPARVRLERRVRVRLPHDVLERLVRVGREGGRANSGTTTTLSSRRGGARRAGVGVAFGLGRRGAAGHSEALAEDVGHHGRGLR